ncbi:homoserine dehydrogenase [Sporolactobacillus inulinus]|uniref:Homoserine dehydrogenase n=1 Tax=Sporolactobacillus inulinus CASD TaxID=1069536 RepID=A0A0U1QR25_9BACL|nr:homoserine dehydrogenase [Sporolactobacillus inulinus]KLI03267.1 homoserine dehydrogenase [Sporolactobacillus inulinus CASD]GEB76800.1 homoserine dehydrogenase [Sporolactobacillus inulinus]
MKKVSVGLLGFGTVGTGVVRLLTKDKERLEERTGCQIQLEKILVRNKNRARKVLIDNRKLTTDVYEILDNPKINVIIELIGGIDQAYRYILRALKNKKNVITANKDLMASYGEELLLEARTNHCDLYYEASVAGGIPILRTLTDSLASDRINKMIGIVNGTTNYILSKMSSEGLSYEKALSSAQRLGFAESDPTSDVEGLDAARKMVILSHLAYSIPVQLADVSIKGITDVTREDIQFAKKLGYTIKLVGVSEVSNGAIDIRVEPTLLPDLHPLASVENENNAIYVHSEALGQTMYYGAGAGEGPTAVSVVSDLISVARNIALNVTGNHIFIPKKELHSRKDSLVESQFFIRMHMKDEPGSFSKLTDLFREQSISLGKLYQEPIPSSDVAEVAIITHITNKVLFENSFAMLKKLDVVVNAKYFRVERG